MTKRPVKPAFFLLIGVLLLTLSLTACDNASSSMFKGFKEVELDSSMKAAIAYYNVATHTPDEESAIALQNLEEKYYTSDEANLEKLANEIDATLIGMGYVFDTHGSPTLKAAGATKPIKQGDFWAGGYSKSGKPDFAFILSSGSKWYGGKNLKWLEVAGADPDSLKKFNETLQSAKSVLYTQSGPGMFKLYAGPTPTPGTTTTPKA